MLAWVTGAAYAETNVSRVEKAQALDHDLRTVEWFTEEYLHHAIRSRSDGDDDKVTFYIKKSLASEKKAHFLRLRTSRAWQRAGQPENAADVWLRAVRVAEVRIQFLEIEQQRLMPVAEGGQLAELGDSADMQGWYDWWLVLDDLSSQWWLIGTFYEEAGNQSGHIASLQKALQTLEPVLALSDEQVMEHRLQLFLFFENAHEWSEALAEQYSQADDTVQAGYYQQQQAALLGRLQTFVGGDTPEGDMQQAPAKKLAGE